MKFSEYLKLLKNRDFSILFATIFLGQMASAFLVLSLIVSNYAKTQSSYAVSGVILSFTIPGFLLIAFAGLAADVFDRRKIIFFAKSFTALIVLALLFLESRVVETTLLSTLYFAGNIFFLPAAQAAFDQVAGKKNVITSNVYFGLIFAGGLIFGFLLTSIIHFFWSEYVALLISLVLMIFAAVISYFLPTMLPKKKKEFTILLTIRDVIRAFTFIFSRKLIWFYFVIFAAAQAVIAFAATVAPGFFKEVLGFSLQKALIFVFPCIGLGAGLGGLCLNFAKRRELYFVFLGLGLITFSFITLGGILKLDTQINVVVYLATAVFLIFIGFGDILLILTSRIALQSRIDHNYQGTVFGASIILSSILSSIFSLLGAETVTSFGYIDTLFFGGVTMLFSSSVVLILVSKRLFGRP